jgi:hypothetical protein
MAHKRKAQAAADESAAIMSALGLLVIAWGTLESVVSSILSTMLDPMLDLKHPQREAILGNIEFRDKLQILRAYGFTIRVDDKWFDTLEASINKIDNDLRPRRNAMIHHNWIQDSNGLELLRNPKPKLKRPQSFQRILEVEMVPVSASDVIQLIQDICEELKVLCSSMVDFQRASSPKK